MSGPAEAVRLLRLGYPEAAAGHLPAEWAPLGVELVRLHHDLERTLARAQAAEAQVAKVRALAESQPVVLNRDILAALGSVGATAGEAGTWYVPCAGYLATPAEPTRADEGVEQ